MPGLVLFRRSLLLGPLPAPGTITLPLDFSETDKLLLGRQRDLCDVLIDDEQHAVSRRHATISVAGAGYLIEDFSRNGSYLNAERLVPATPTPIQHDDQLRVCDFHYRFVDDRCACGGREPFVPQAFSDSWRTEHTLGLAAKMRDEQAYAALPILADALEEAGCDNIDILIHCRELGVHAPGCWVVGLVLGGG